MNHQLKFRITSEFGAMEEVREGAHTGFDLAMNVGTELRSLQDGLVEKVLHLKNNIGDGVLIKFEDGTTGIYGHMSKINVTEGQQINAGDLIGLSGNSGNSTGPHLHFGMKDANGEFVDPSPVIEQVAAMSGENTNWFLENYNAFADKVIGSQYQFILKPLGHFCRDVSIDVWNWFVLNLPDIIGYTTIGAGVVIILSSMVGKGGMLKTIGWYFGAFILATCILGGV
jgi:hypothetical protein